jgi:hypothetical protein
MLVAFAGTVTDAGNVTAELLVDRLTLSPAAGAALASVTVQASVAEPLSDALLQDNALNDWTGTTEPSNATEKKENSIKSWIIRQGWCRQI